jgi:hypothetical protein
MFKIKIQTALGRDLHLTLFCCEQCVMALGNRCLYSSKKHKSSKICLGGRHLKIPVKELTFLKLLTYYSAFAKAEPI